MGSRGWVEDAKEDDAKMVLRADSESEMENPESGSSRVLVIDSDDVDRRLIRRMIGDRFEVLEASDGHEGLALHRAQSPACVLLDQGLSDSSGTSVFDALVQEGATVVLLTNSGDAEYALNAVRRGAQDYLDKNSLNEVMLERVIRYATERGRLKHELHRSISDLKESELKFSEMAEHIDHGIWVWSMDVDRCTYQNPACERIYGRTLREWNDVDWYEVIHPDDRDAEIDRDSRCAESKTEYESCFRIIRPDDQIRHVEQSAYPLLDENGDLIRIIGVCRDITERIQLEEELRLAHKLEAVGQLAAGVAHEINTPSQYVSDNIAFISTSFNELTSVLLAYGELIDWARNSGMSDADVDRYSEMAAKVDLDFLLEEMPVALQQSRDGLEQIKKIVRAMKDFSHPGDDMEAVDVNHAIESTATVARNEWKYVAELELNLDPDLPRVICVPSALNQVILNLIVNSAHAIGDVVRDRNGEKGQIRIRTEVRGSDALIEVADTGCGIPRDICDRIFDPFFTTKEVGKGTGQGLAIAHSVITERHNGSINVSSEPGHGTTFTIELPIDGERAQHEGQAA